MDVLRPSRLRLIAAVVCAAAGALVSCGGSGGASITLLASSSNGDDVDVTYSIDGKTTTATVASPWELVVDVGERFDVELTVMNRSDDGEVACGFDGDVRGPDGDGPGGVECIVSGTARGNAVSTSGTVRALPRDADALPLGEGEDEDGDGSEVADPSDETVAETADDGGDAELGNADAADDSVDVVFELVSGGEVVDAPVQYERIGLRVRVVGIDGVADDDYVVWTTSNFDGGGFNRKVTQTVRYDREDLDGRGELTHEITDGDAYSIGQPGFYRLTLEGSVRIGDDEYPIDESLTFDVAEVIPESRFVDGVFRAEYPTSWEITANDAFGFVVDEDFDVTGGFNESLEEVLSFTAFDGAGDLAVFRSRRPGDLVSLEAAADGIAALFDSDFLGDRTSIDVGGFAGVRVNASFVREVDDGDDVSMLYVADIVRVDTELFLIQQRAEEGSRASEEADAIRASLEFDPSRFSPIGHSVAVGLQVDEGSGDVARLRVPASWKPVGDDMFVSSDERLGLDVVTTAETLTTDELVERVVASMGAPGAVEIVNRSGDLEAVTGRVAGEGAQTTFVAAISEAGVTVVVRLVARDGEVRDDFFPVLIDSIVVI